MAGILGNTIEFLIGLFAVPVVANALIFLLILFVGPLFGIDSANDVVSAAGIFSWVVRISIFAGIFFIRKMVAVGFGVSVALDVLFGFAQFS